MIVGRMTKGLPDEIHADALRLLDVSREVINLTVTALWDGGNAVELQSLIEQACNFYLQNGCFPDTYEEMQPMPALNAGILPYAGDDGPQMGQTYRTSYDLGQKRLTLALRTPNVQGEWARTWREKTIQMTLPDRAPVLFSRFE